MKLSYSLTRLSENNLARAESAECKYSHGENPRECSQESEECQREKRATGVEKCLHMSLADETNGRVD